MIPLWILNAKEAKDLSSLKNDFCQEWKNLSSSIFCCPSCPHNKNERKWKFAKILRSCKRAVKAMKQEDDSDSNHSWNSHQKPGKEIELTGDQRKYQDRLTTALQKSAWILRRVLEIWRNLLSLKLQWKINQFNLVWKTSWEQSNNYIETI